MANCKPDDLAMFTNPENAGRMVRVIGNSPRQEEVQRLYPRIGHCWECEALSEIRCWERGIAGRWIVMPRGSILCAVPDSTIKPIRPGDEDAEIVRELYAPGSPALIETLREAGLL